MLFKFQLLRYAPNRLSEEFYNIAVLLYGSDGRLVDARFAPDFLRLRCHPLADLPFLRSLREEFEERRLAGEGFSGYVDELTRNLSQSLQLSEEKSLLAEEAPAVMDRLKGTYLATPRRAELRTGEAPPGTRRWIRTRLEETFRLYHVLERLDRDVAVGTYVSPRFSFRVDYAYQPNGHNCYIQALSMEHDLQDASRLCFVFDRIRAQAPAEMTAVVGDNLPADTRGLLETSQIRPFPVGRADQLALAVRQALGN